MIFRKLKESTPPESMAAQSINEHTAKIDLTETLERKKKTRVTTQDNKNEVKEKEKRHGRRFLQSIGQHYRKKPNHSSGERKRSFIGLGMEKRGGDMCERKPRDQQRKECEGKWNEKNMQQEMKSGWRCELRTGTVDMCRDRLIELKHRGVE